MSGVRAEQQEFDVTPEAPDTCYDQEQGQHPRGCWPLLLPSQCSRHHVLAFWNIRSHGDAGSSRFQYHGIHGHCHLRKQRSG